MGSMKMKNIAKYSMIALAVSLYGCGDSADRELEYFNKAQQFADAENYNKAKIELKNVLQINPKNPEARFLLAELAEKDKDYRAAYGNFKAVVDEDPQHLAALNKLASYHILSKDYEKGLEYVESALVVDPNSADALANKAGYFWGTENKPSAIEFAKKAVESEPGHVGGTALLVAVKIDDKPQEALAFVDKSISENQEGHEALSLLRIKVLEKMGDNDAVIESYKALMQKYPENLAYGVNLVKFYLKDESRAEEERKQLAESLLRQMVKDNPDELKLKKLFVEYLLKAESVDVAKAELQEFVKQNPESFELKDQLAKLNYAAGEKDKAIAIYEQFVVDYPDSVDALGAKNSLISIYVQEQDINKVNKLIDEVLEKEPENEFALITKARRKMADGSFEASIPDLRIVLKNDPNSIPALLLLAKCQEETDAADLAIDNYQRVLKLQENNLPALLSFGRLNTAKGLFDVALPTLEKSLELSPGNPEAIRLLTDIYTKQERWDDALSVTTKLVESENTAAIGHYLQGRVYLRQKDFKNAEKSLKTSLSIDDRIVEALSSLVSAQIGLDKKADSIKYVEKHVAKNQDHLHAKEILANLYITENKLDLAEKMLKEIVDEKPGQLSSYRALARILSSQNRMDEIEVLYKAGLKKEPKNAELKVMMAELYQVTDRYDDAVDVYEEVLREYPDAILVRNNLASLLLDHFDSAGNIARALEYSKPLQESKNAAFLDTAGWAHYKSENYPQALSLLQAANAAGGTTPVYLYHLGMAYYKNDLTRQAEEKLGEALKNKDIQFPGRKEAEKTYKKLTK